MIIYNVTMKVDWNIAEEWVQWMQLNYMPGIISTGCFEKHQFVQLLQVDEAEGPTFAAQYYAKNIGDYNHYIQNHARDFSDVINKKWGDRCIAFGTLMKVI